MNDMHKCVFHVVHAAPSHSRHMLRTILRILYYFEKMFWLVFSEVGGWGVGGGGGVYRARLQIIYEWLGPPSIIARSLMRESPKCHGHGKQRGAAAFGRCPHFVFVGVYFHMYFTCSPYMVFIFMNMS